MIRKSFKAVEILVLNFYNCDGQGICSLWLPVIAKTMLRKKNKTGGVMLTDQTKLQESKQHGAGTRNRHVDEQNRIESPELNPWPQSQLIYTKGGKNMQ